MSRFTLPRDIYYGPGALDELKVLAGHKKAMIFTGGSSMRRGGFLQKTEEVLKAAGLETALFEGIEPDPSIETVMKGAPNLNRTLSLLSAAVRLSTQPKPCGYFTNTPIKHSRILKHRSPCPSCATRQFS